MNSLTRWSFEFTMENFTQRLKTLREQRKLTQTRLAELLEISPRVYNRWEKGAATPHFDTMIRIADLLDVSLDELAGRTEAPSEPRIRNLKLHTLYQELDQLPDEDQQAVIVLLDSLVKRAKFESVLAQ
jgi:transcriptional regulator with XRE-family HTH domain